MTQNEQNATRTCWCGCEGTPEGDFLQGHDQRVLYTALELLGYGKMGAIHEFLEAHDFQPGGARGDELRAAVAKRYSECRVMFVDTVLGVLLCLILMGMLFLQLLILGEVKKTEITLLSKLSGQVQPTPGDTPAMEYAVAGPHISPRVQRAQHSPQSQETPRPTV